jgi:hypothetical protein
MLGFLGGGCSSFIIGAMCIMRLFMKQKNDSEGGCTYKS